MAAIVRRVLHRIAPLFGLIIFFVALGVLHHQLREYHYRDIMDQLGSIPAHKLYLAGCFTILGYLFMTGYDMLALRYIGYQLAYHKTVIASFISYAFSNNIGLSMLAGGSVRYRLYPSWGLSAGDVTKVVIYQAQDGKVHTIIVPAS